MSQPTVRISETTHHVLKELSRAKQEPMQVILELAVEEYRRRCFLESVNDAYGALRSDAKAWQEIEVQRQLWDPTLNDGLPQNEEWTKGGQPVSKKKTRRK